MCRRDNQALSLKKMNVVQVLPELDSGGVERGTLEMGRYLVEHGHRSIVVSAGGRMVHQLEQEGSIHHQLPVGAKNLRILSSLKPFFNLLKEENVDILHLRSRLPAWIGFLATKTLPSSRKPVIITTFHGFYSVNGYSSIMTRGDCVIAVSKTIREHIRSAYGVEENVRLVYRGVDPETFNPDAVSSSRVKQLRRKWKLKEKLPVLMLPGRVTRIKGHNLFIKSLMKMRQRNFQAVIVGSYDKSKKYYRDLKHELACLGLAEHVQLVGQCDDMPAALLLADIVVNTSSSRAEAFGRTIIEAMAMTKPVIATAHGGSTETIIHNKTGWLVAPSDPEAMAEQLDFGLQHQDRLRTMGELGRKHVQEYFNTSIMCEKTLSLYLEYIRKNKGA